MARQADATRKLLEALNASGPEGAADLITDDFLDHHVRTEIPRGLKGSERGGSSSTAHSTGVLTSTM